MGTAEPGVFRIAFPAILEKNPSIKDQRDRITRGPSKGLNLMS
jgi:hypothetical protein